MNGTIAHNAAFFVPKLPIASANWYSRNADLLSIEVVVPEKTYVSPLTCNTTRGIAILVSVQILIHSMAHRSLAQITFTHHDNPYNPSIQTGYDCS